MYEVNGYQFKTEEEASLAKKEAEGIKYIKSKTAMDDPDVVLTLYNRLLQKNYFQTPVGMAFLAELHEYLHTIPYIKNEDIRPIPVKNIANEKERAKEKAKERKNEQKAELKQAQKLKAVESINYKRKYHIALFFAVVFGVIILGMFTIVYYSSDNITILNYENAILDKYSEWDSQLKEKEAQLREREANLNKAPDTTEQ